MLALHFLTEPLKQNTLLSPKVVSCLIETLRYHGILQELLQLAAYSPRWKCTIESSTRLLSNCLYQRILALEGKIEKNGLFSKTIVVVASGLKTTQNVL